MRQRKQIQTLPNILVVDDEEMITTLLKVGLEEIFACTVTVAHSAEMALTKLHISPEYFDLVITDFQMPGKNGIDLVDEICTSLYYPPKLILYSGYLDEDRISEALEAGVYRVLHKPVQMTAWGKILWDAFSDLEERRDRLREGSSPLQSEVMHGMSYCPGINWELTSPTFS